MFLIRDGLKRLSHFFEQEMERFDTGIVIGIIILGIVMLLFCGFTSFSVYSDGYSKYNKRNGITRVGCGANLRRKFAVFFLCKRLV